MAVSANFSPSKPSPPKSSAPEFSDMQQDAFRRVQEMQRRARRNLEASNQAMVSPPPRPEPAPAETKNPSPALPLQGVPEIIGPDGETGLLLMLILLLLNDGADRALILALLYILLG